MSELPEEIVEYIISFLKNRWDNIIYLHNPHRIKMRRVFNELKHWKCSVLSVSFLKPSYGQRLQKYKFLESLRNGKPSVVYHTGFFSTEWNECSYIQLCKIAI